MIVEVIFDHPRIYSMKLEKIKMTESGFVFDEEGYGSSDFEKMNVQFLNDTHSYEVIARLNKYVLGWDLTPSAAEMSIIAKRWEEMYEAKLIRISHSTLSFKCRKLSEIEALNLLDEIKAIHGLIIDCEPEEVVEYLKRAGGFTIWWD